ncbi:MAG: tetratricopeptide repeat protein [Pseudomonadota bacterium]
MALTDEMRDFVNRIRGRLMRDPDPARYLARRLEREEFFPDGYYTETTRTAAGVFEERSGNCLSYTNLFIALARYAGLDARFQFARVPANWSSQAGFLVRSRHISARVIESDLLGERAVTVDFNQVQNVGLFPHRLVKDDFALSSFYSNLAVDSLYAQRLREALRLLALANEVAPENPDPWVNAAVVWSSAGNVRKAHSALAGALTVDPTNESALSGLARIFEARGDQERADWYRQTIQRNRDADPYYQFARARAAFDKNELNDSKTYITRAITLRGSIGHFHYLAGIVHYRLGDYDAARTALEAAHTVRSPVSSAKREHTLRLLADLGPLPVDNEMCTDANPGCSSRLPPGGLPPN